ncbi:hypothetical protein VSX61_20060 [Brenneria populi subsp. brevivirga]|uniref:hypothetical protein n=1 Tax=Brenneria populi TaxID=1505588 RepID=UPI002E187C6A|nr:hypothetical protein [Brenneria populi subsp. brevivirga]
MSKLTNRQITDLYSAAVSSEVNEEAGDAASASRFELYDQLDATGGAGHTIRVLIDMLRAGERERETMHSIEYAQGLNARIAELESTINNLRESVAASKRAYEKSAGIKVEGE